MDLLGLTVYCRDFRWIQGTGHWRKGFIHGLCAGQSWEYKFCEGMACYLFMKSYEKVFMKGVNSYT